MEVDQQNAEFSMEAKQAIFAKKSAKTFVNESSLALPRNLLSSLKRSGHPKADFASTFRALEP